MNTYASIRIANAILDRAERYNIEIDALIRLAEHWFDDIRETFEDRPDYVQIMEELDADFGREDFEQAIDLLISVQH